MQIGRLTEKSFLWLCLCHIQMNHQPQDHAFEEFLQKRVYKCVSFLPSTSHKLLAWCDISIMFLKPANQRSKWVKHLFPIAETLWLNRNVFVVRCFSGQVRQTEDSWHLLASSHVVWDPKRNATDITEINLATHTAYPQNMLASLVDTDNYKIVVCCLLMGFVIAWWLTFWTINREVRGSYTCQSRNLFQEIYVPPASSSHLNCMVHWPYTAHEGEDRPTALVCRG